MITGTKNIPVVLLSFRDTSGDQAGNPLFDSGVLQRTLFDGDPSRPGKTIGDLYREMSYGTFTVRGTVYRWKALSQNGSFYEGKDYQAGGAVKHCNGLCDSANIATLIREAVDLNSDVDWGQYDNDGPDGMPNSGDDDGYVDFVAFAHPKSGAECNRSSTNIWSHRSSYSNWTGSEYVTKSKSANGGFIKIDDYTIQPAYACDAVTPNQIGVFAHEFGHAFGLPDLYDTSGRSEGLGNWCLMSAGSWGGDGQSPDQPVHMSPWAKEFMGWIRPVQVSADLLPATIATIEDHPDVYKIRISSNQYYLLDNVGKKLFNSKLPGSGLQIWRVNETAVNSGMRSNRVNFDPENMGVELIEADGLRRLHRISTPSFRGGPGDLFPGPQGRRSFDRATNPSSIGRVAVCDIGDPGNAISARILISRNMCASPSPTPAAPQPNDNALSIDRVLKDPSAFFGKNVEVIGRIENKGSNLQLREGRKLMLTDAAGNSIAVRLPMPIEAALPKDQTATQGVTASAVLDETVRVTGIVERDPSSGQPRIAIKNAKVLGK
ncbi:MAG: M6 family metalloprotease domain-containing protein [Bryobacterales bacterium]|nr:M6 family metalloprotease domain-containing protein [Bryobacterales bacterium]